MFGDTPCDYFFAHQTTPFHSPRPCRCDRLVCSYHPRFRQFLICIILYSLGILYSFTLIFVLAQTRRNNQNHRLDIFAPRTIRQTKRSSLRQCHQYIWENAASRCAVLLKVIISRLYSLVVFYTDWEYEVSLHKTLSNSGLRQSRKMQVSGVSPMLSVLHSVPTKLCVGMTIGLSGGILQWFTNLYNLVRCYTVWESWKYHFVIPKIRSKSPVRKFCPFRGVFMRFRELVMSWWHIWENLASCRNIGLFF